MKITEFWTWFQQNEGEIRCAIIAKDDTEDSVLYSLFDYLDFFSPHLTCELRHLEQERLFAITLSCWGNRDTFLMVETLVAAAPKIAKWKVKAFIEPKPDSYDTFDTPYKLYNWNVIPSTIKFAVYNFDLEKEIYDLILLLPLFFRDKEEEEIVDYFYTMFQNIWGEKFVGRRINSLLFTFNHDAENYVFLEIADMHFVLENFKFAMGIEEG